MKFKKEFMLREIVGETALIPIGETGTHFNGLISVNELGRFIWENYEKAQDKNELLGFILDEYEVEKDVAKADLDEFLKILEDAEII
ncbi:PqqD family protein [Intestinibacter sp.]